MNRISRGFAWMGLSLAAALALSCGGGGGGGGYSGGGGGGGGSTPPQYHVWVGKDGAMTFTPVNIRVAPGATVTWDFFGLHTVSSVAPATELESGNLSSGTYTHAFPTEGVFNYYCKVHGTMMSGTVTVQTGGSGYGVDPHTGDQ